MSSSNRKCYSSIPSSFASVYLITVFLAISLVSFLCLKYPQHQLDYLRVIIYHEPTPNPLSDTTRSVNLTPTTVYEEKVIVAVENLPDQLPPPSVVNSPVTKTIAEEEKSPTQEDEEIGDDHLSFPPYNSSAEERMEWMKQALRESKIVESSSSSRKFDEKMQQFMSSKRCRVNIFMTWISSTKYFGKRELFSLESVVKAHPEGCVFIISRIMASKSGREMIQPLGHRVLPIAPDFPLLFKGTPAHDWLQRLQAGQIDPGEIPITQNLSNLLRLALLYKYGGLYFDTDMIILKDVSALTNSIGIQQIYNDRDTWNTVNNAVLVFDKEHPLLLRFMEEFNSTFDGNQWGHNGPFMATRVIKQAVLDSRYHFNLMSQMAFYPVDWINIARFFWNPNRNNDTAWAKDMFFKVNKESYGVHLWNKVTHDYRIQQSSIIGRLISQHCIICQDVYAS